MDDYIPQPRPRLDAAAATQVLDFLYELIADFESAYAAQILRHRQAEAEYQPGLRQRSLFDDPDPF